MDTDVERGTTSELYNEVEETVDPAQLHQVEYEPDIEKGGPANVLSGKIIRKLDQAPRQFRKNYIFRVDDIIRKGHENHYEPILFAFGPYHRGKTKLQPMEEHKWQCLNGMIERVTKQNCISRSDLINRCCEMLKGFEDEARGYYADDTTGLDSGEFLEMLLLDGCFLLESLRKNHSASDDPLMNMAQIERILLHDLLLLENQLPFFILENLDDAVKTGNDEKGSSVLLLTAIKSIFFFAAHSIRSPARAFQDYTRTMIDVSKLYGKYEHLVNISSEGMKQYLTDLEVQEKGREVDPEKLKNTKHLLELIYKVLLKEDILDIIPEVTSTTRQVDSQGASNSIFDILNESRYNTYTVTELSNAGVKFKPIDDQKFYGIQFKNSTLEIPRITITRHTTEGLLRNLIANEMGDDESQLIISDYVSFMDSLISSGKDVELLRIHGIIEHYLGDDEAVSMMFNKINAVSVRPVSVYYYSDIVKQLKHHCEKRKNVWIAKLRSDYFSSPWTIISVIAAFILLVLTIISTVYTPLSYYNAG